MRTGFLLPILTILPLTIGVFTATPAQAASSRVSGTADCWGMAGYPLPAEPAATVRIQTGSENKKVNVNNLLGGTYSVNMTSVPKGGIDATVTVDCVAGGRSWSLPARLTPGDRSLDLTNPTPLDVAVYLRDPSNGQPVNLTPVASRQRRPLTVGIYNASDQLVTTRTVTAQQRTYSDEYDGTVYAGHLAPGSYTIKVNLDYTLRTQAGFITLTDFLGHRVPPQRYSQSATVTPGDLNSDNRINITDYNLLMNCFSDIAPPRGPCSAQQKIAADITVDGSVNGPDYNLMLRILNNRSGD